MEMNTNNISPIPDTKILCGRVRKYSEISTLGSGVGTTPPSRINSRSTTTYSNENVISEETTPEATPPPPKQGRFRVRNPFEVSLAERLQFPVIASPTLFQVPTPQLSSTKFEWTIDEVSSLQPVDVEPHETQFEHTPDPEYEAKLQTAISLFFKEQKIVPSPINCPLRNQRIILSELNGDTPVTKQGRRTRDCCVQTELTLPPTLPKELEDALRPYFQPHLTDNVVTTPENSLQLQRRDDIKDVSLRRKLFDAHNIILFDDNNQLIKTSPRNNSNSSPKSVSSPHYSKPIVGKLSDSLDKSSFGFLSPITATEDGLSPSSQSSNCHSSEHKTSRKFLRDLIEIEDLSPIHPPLKHRGSLKKCEISLSKQKYRLTVDTSKESMMDMTAAEEFSSNRSSSPMPNLQIKERSHDSINFKVSRLQMNNSNNESFGITSGVIIKNKDLSKYSMQDMNNSDTTEMCETDLTDDDVQISQLSVHSSNGNTSINPDTPRLKRRSASRKNLSHSFTANWLKDEETNDAEYNTGMTSKIILPLTNNVSVLDDISNVFKDQQLQITKTGERSTIYHTDSGFNEITTSTSTSYSAFPQDEFSRDGFVKTSNIIEATTTSAVPTKTSKHFSPIKIHHNMDTSDGRVIACSTPYL